MKALSFLLARACFTPAFICGLMLLSFSHASRAATAFGTGSFTWDNGTTTAWSTVSGGLSTNTWTSGNDAVISMPAAPPIVVTNPATTTGTAGLSFSQVFTQTGAVGAVIFSLNSGTLPAGLTLDIDGTLSGTPTQTGTFPITVKVTDFFSGTGTGATYNLVINCQTISVEGPGLNFGTVGAAFSQTFTQSYGIGTTTFTTASTLPNGLTLGSNGTLSGTPTQTGTFPIVVTATDSNGCTGSSATYNLVINCQTITVGNPVTNTGTVASAFSETFTQLGGMGATTFSTLSVLPNGLTLGSNGTLSGTPTQSGTFPIIVTVTDGNGCTGSGPTYNLVINCPTITVSNPVNSSGTMGSLFFESFGQTGGALFPFPPVFSTSSVLPNGITLNSSGTLSGTPTQSGTFPITVTVTDTYNCTGSSSIYNLVITGSLSDYTVTTTGNAIVVTDVSGNGDTLVVSEPAAGSIKFAAAGRTFSVDGGAPITGDSGDLPLAGVTSITVNAEAGNDTISVGAFTSSMPGLTINGGTGDDTVNFTGSIAFAAGANLDLDLQNDDATPGTDTVNLGASAIINTSGTGTITARASRRVSMTTGAKFTTVDGGVTLEGNQQAVPTAGNFSGVRLDGATIQSTGTGQIVLKGRGGVDAANASNVGVSINGTSLVSTVGADITLDGRGSASTTFASGVAVRSSSNVTTSGAGNIQITGVAAPCTDTLSRTYGIYMDGAGTVTSTGTGPAAGGITMHGTGGTGVTFCIGVVIVSTGTGVSAVDGDIAITGISGNGTGTSNDGVDIENLAFVRSTGTGANAGNITINGTGGLGTFGSLGVILINSGEATVVDGDLTITGTGGGGTGPYNEGVGVFGAAVLRSSGTGAGAGTITINGTGNGAAGGTESNGVSVRDASSLITSVDGAVVITGTPGTGASTSGVRIGYNAGVVGAVTSTGTAPLTFVADSIFFDTGATINSTSSAVTLRQKTNGTQIDLGAADSAGVLGLTDAELDHVTAGTLVIGNGNSGPIAVSAVISPLNYKTLAFGKDTSFAATGGFASDVTSLSSYEKITVTGTMNIAAGATFSATSSGGYVWNGTDSFVFLNNDSTDAITGTFTGPTLTSFLGSALTATQTYTGLTGNDFVVGNTVSPTIGGISPPAGGLSGGNVVTITGSGFTGALDVTFNGISVSFTVVNDTTITAVVPSTATAGPVPVAVIAPGGTTSQVNGYTYVDYLVSTTGASITVTDASGNGDTLAITEPAAGSIKFAAVGRFFIVDGGAPITGDSGNLPLSGITSITVNAATGNDTINVSAFTSSMPGLTINGGIGDDTVNLNGSITFAAGASLDLDLQNDDATPGTDTLNLAASSVINTSGSGTITARTSSRIALFTGSKFTAVDGGITLEANQQAVPTAANLTGVRLDGATVQSTGTGAILLKGRGADDLTTSSHVGVVLLNTSTVSTIGAGITLDGRGGLSTAFGAGIAIRTNSIVTTVSGAISINGNGAPATAVNSLAYGIYLDSGALITSTGTGAAVGNITIFGQGNTGVKFTSGIAMFDATSLISAVDADISITAIAGDGTLPSNHGINLQFGPRIISTGTGPNAGNITINGTAGLGSSGSLGVQLIDAATEVSVVDGDLNITGTGGAGSGPYNEGVGVFTAKVRSTGTGASAGKITINGTGNGAAGGTESNGVSIRGTGSLVTSVDGAVSITGTGGTGASTYGIHLGYAAPNGDGAVTSTGAAPISLIADSFTVESPFTVSGGTVNVRQKTNNTQINLGAADSAGVLGLTDAELDFITAGTLSIGDANSGMITLSAAISRAASTNMNFTSGADIVQQAGVNTLGGDVIVSAGSIGGHAYGAGAVGTEFAMLGASTGTVSFGSGPVLSLGLGSLASHESLDVNGKVNLTGLGLDLTGAWVPVIGDVMTIVNNDDTDAITGIFTGQPQGSLVNYNGDKLLISYVGGTGNDVSLTAVGEYVTSGGALVLNVEDFLAPSTVPGTIANATVVSGNVNVTDGDRVRLTLPAGKTVTAASAVITNIVGGSGPGVNTPGIIRFKDTGGATLSSTNFIANGSHSLNLPAPQVTGTFDLEMVSPTQTTGSTVGNADYVITLTIGDIATAGPAPVNFTLGDVITGANAPDAAGAQDGTQFDALQRSGYLAENGALAFLGYLKIGVGGVTNSNFMGYWKEEGGSTTLTRLARMGDSAPETGATAAKFNILPLIPGINDAGQVTLHASLLQSTLSNPVTDASNDLGIWSELGGTGFQILIRENDVIPNGGGAQVDSLGWGCFATAKTSATTGEAAFVVGMKGASSDTALLRTSVVNSDTTAVGFIARENAAAPGAGENFGGLDNTVTRAARMDAQGNVVFAAALKTSGRTGIWYQPPGGAVQKAILTGDAAPGTTATFQQFDLPNMGGNGTYAFRGVLNAVGDNANNDKNDGIWRGAAATAPALILRRGDTNTSRPGLFGSTYTNTYPNIKAGNIYNGWLTNANHGAWLGWVDLGGNGISAFPYDGNFTSATDTFGIYTDVSGTMSLLIASGDAAPGIASSKFFFIDHPVCGGIEQVAFVGTVTGGGVTAGTNDKGVWRTNPQSTTPTLVLRTGDSMTVNINGVTSSKTIADLDIPGSNYPDHIWETPVMDGTGRLLIFVTFTDGSTTQVIVP